MCGIIGIVAKIGNVAPDLVKGLKYLEYRGYDSAGVATVEDRVIHVKKDKGMVDDIEKRMRLSTLPGSIGIAHTRWATHGAPEQVNAHPHTDCENKIAVVHNGIINNFNDIKQRLIKAGHVFKSLTDTEVVPHLIEENMRSGMDFRSAVFEAVKELDGSFALGIVSVYEPDTLICVKKESPLILGVGRDAMYCASDVSSLVPFTKKVVVLDDGELAVLTPTSYEIYRLPDFSRKDKTPIEIDLKVEDAFKSGYPHYMLKEIYEQPTALSYTTRLQEHYLNLMADLLDRSKEIYIVAAGTSYHAGLIGSYLLSKMARLVAIPVIASEFITSYGDAVSVESTILAISQSGETYDVLKAIEYAKSRAATILGITNVLASTLTRVSRVYIHQQSGPEIGVAATKTFTGQLAVLYQLALIAGKRRGKLSQRELDDLKEAIHDIPRVVEETLKKTDPLVKKLAKKYCKSKFFMFLGRGLSYPVALEGRLKLLEISYIPALAYPAGESKHGPISLIEEGIPVIFVAPRDETRKYVLSNIEEMKARGATIIALGEEGDEELMGLSDDYIGLPPVNPYLAPIPYVVPLQLFAYHTSVLLGRDPDRPRNLAKSVTVL